MNGSSEKASAPKTIRHTYLEMVQVALLTLNERGGSSRQEIWKCIDARFPEADHKRYMLALKRIVGQVGQNAVVHGKNNMRFKLETKFRDRALKRQEKGLPLRKVLSSDAMVDKVKKAVKAKKKPAKKPKKANKNSKGKKKNDAKGKTSRAKAAAANKSTKDKIKAKAKQNKKTEGSAKTKSVVNDKRKTGDKKVKASTKANTNKAKKEQKDARKSKGKSQSKTDASAKKSRGRPSNASKL